MGEVVEKIRQDALRSKVQGLPKNVQLRIKNMLIAGKISCVEYKKFMSVLDGSNMRSFDKIEM